MVLTQPVAQRGLRGAHVAAVTRQQPADPGRPRRVLIPQPVFALLAVGRDHLLGSLVDVGGHDSGHGESGRAYQPGVIGLTGEFPEQQVGEAGMPEPVGAQQGGQRRAALRQAARVLDGRDRGLHSGQVDPVLHDLQARIHVAVDAGSEQGQ
jgi:hypothetical protein